MSNIRHSKCILVYHIYRGRLDLQMRPNQGYHFKAKCLRGQKLMNPSLEVLNLKLVSKCAIKKHLADFLVYSLFLHF